MEITGTLEKARSEGWTDEEVIDRVKAGDTALYELVMRRYNQRLYRIARAILRDDAEAEDVMQDAYVRAYQHLDQFAERAPSPLGSRALLSTKRWLASAGATAASHCKIPTRMENFL